jgi:hypothetical protein
MPLSTASIADGPGKFHGAEQTNRHRRAILIRLLQAYLLLVVSGGALVKKQSFLSRENHQYPRRRGLLGRGPDNQLTQRPKM